jgi:probable phosphoglycerate mutase
MQPSSVIALVRHGMIALDDDQRRYIGQIDLPLTEEGRRQAGSLARRFAHAHLAAIACSDLSRSRETAELIGAAAGITPSPRAELREISMGAWENLTFREVAQRFPEAYRARGEDLGNFCVPGGESFAQCSRRVVAAFEDFARTVPGNLLIVGHAGVNRLILCHVLGMDPSRLFRLGQDYACLNLIQRSSSGYQVRLINGRARAGRRG